MERVTRAGVASRIAAFFRRSPQPLVYAVRLEVDPSIIQDYDEWLLLHVREMLAFPGFQTARVYRGQELTADNRVVRIAVYEVRSRRELDSYLHTHAARMRKDGQRRFGNRFSASREIVPVEQYSPPDDVSVLYGEQEITGGLPLCANCHAPVDGRFCSNCGQEDRTYMLSMGQLAYEFVGDLFNFDSRLFRTLKPLLFQPGRLTAYYIFGRRQQFLPPVRMYIFISLAFFFLATLLTDVQLAIPEGDGSIAVETGSELTPAERERVQQALRQTETELGLPAGLLNVPAADGKTDQQPTVGEPSGSEEKTEQQASQQTDYQGPNIWISDDEVDVSGFGGGEFEERVERGARSLKSNPRAFVEKLIQQIPTMMFVFLPLIALVLKLLYIGSGRYYVEHLVFTLHYHSAIFVLLLFWLLMSELDDHIAALDPVMPWVTTAVTIYIPVHLYRSLRCVYGQGHLLTSLKFLLLFIAYVLALAATLVMAMVYTMYLQS